MELDTSVKNVRNEKKRVGVKPTLFLLLSP